MGTKTRFSTVKVDKTNYVLSTYLGKMRFYPPPKKRKKIQNIEKFGDKRIFHNDSK